MGRGSEKQTAEQSAPSEAKADADGSSNDHKLAELIRRAQTGDHRALLQLRHLQARRRKKSAGTVNFSDAEAGTITASSFASKGGGADAAIEGGVTDGQEEREEKGVNYEGDSLAADGFDKLAKDVADEPGGELHVPHGMHGPHGEGHEMGAAGKAGIAIATRAVLIPRIVSLLRHHEYKAAVKVLTDSVGWEERAEIVKLVLEKAGAELGPQALKWFGRIALTGAVVDVVGLGWEWTKMGLDAIQEAHEHGDRDSRIAIYAYAWSDTVLHGHHSNPGAIDAEQREAMKKGIEDGLATRESNPDLAGLMLAQYETDANARHALEDALLRKAGISVRTHHGR